MSAETVPTDVYPVGVLHTLQIVGRALTVPALRGKRIGIARNALRSERRFLVSRTRARDWRAVRNAFNGYLAEHDRCAHNAGRGWTQRAARRRVERICDRHIAASLDALSSHGSSAPGDLS